LSEIYVLTRLLQFQEQILKRLEHANEEPPTKLVLQMHNVDKTRNLSIANRLRVSCGYKVTRVSRTPK